MENGNILVVDDNKSILSTLRILLMQEFKLVKTISNPELIPAELEQADYDIILLDMNFRAGVNTGNEGIYWLNKIKEINNQISVVMITAFGDVDLAVKALKAGATDFVLKPWDNEKLLATVRSAIELSLSKKEVSNLKLTTTTLKQEINSSHKNIIGNSQRLMEVLEVAEKVAKTDANVLITGENGTGKELVAREIHRLSARHNEVMVSVDMGALSESLFESELFGHAKGSFTDASENKPGKFEIASKGTLFLDEIGNLSYHLQAKLLSALQSRQITRIGSNSAIDIDIRLVCATNKDIVGMVDQGLFREDLLYRINTIQIEMPPLRERGDDILLLAEFFLEKYSAKYNKPKLKIAPKALERLQNYAWPGNIRELQHTIEKAVILSESNVLKPDSFFMKPMSVSKSNKEVLTLEEIEKQYINNAIDRHSGNFSAAAAELGITRQTLYNKIKKMDL